MFIYKGIYFSLYKKPIRQWKKSLSFSYYKTDFTDSMCTEVLEAIESTINNPIDFWYDKDSMYYLSYKIGTITNTKIILDTKIFIQEVKEFCEKRQIDKEVSHD